MTAQASDRLEMDGNTFLVRGYIEIPPGIEPPPREAHATDTAHWRGYTCRWEVNTVDGVKRLYLVGFSCGSYIDSYLPLHRPVMNPISVKVKVVPAGAKRLKYVHMGFESKYAGEQYLIFQWGKLVGIEKIADDVPAQDGLLDMAGLHPKGEKRGHDEIKRFLSRHSGDLDTDNQKEFRLACSACETEVISERELDPKKILCHSCRGKLVEVGKAFKNWDCSDESAPYAAVLSDTIEIYGGSEVNPEWHRKSRLHGEAFLKFGENKKTVMLETFGYQRFIMKGNVETYKNVDRDLDKKLTDYISVEASGRSSAEIKIEGVKTIFVEKDFTMEAPVIFLNGELNSTAIAECLEMQLEKVVKAWVKELLELLPILKVAWKSSIDCLTGGSGIYPYDPSMMTPQDEKIFWELVYRKLRLTEPRKWAIPPRHTGEGWLPGVKIQDLYLKNLNL